MTRSVALCCAALGLLIQLIGVILYGFILGREYTRLARNTAQQASVSIYHATDFAQVVDEVMSIYRSVREAEQSGMDEASFRALFEGVESGPDYHYLEGMLRTYSHYNDVYDTYIAALDETGGALVMIVDSNSDDGLHPGDHKPVSDRFLNELKTWNGQDDLHLYSKQERIGWTGTAPVALRDSGGKTAAYLFVEVTLRDMILALRQFALAILLCVAAATLLISLIFSKRMKRTVSAPINAIASAAQAYVSDKRSGTGETSHFAGFQIHTGDEMENLS